MSVDRGGRQEGYSQALMKPCTTCKEVKPLSDFNRNRRTRDGLQCYCRPCDNERSRRYHAANPHKYLGPSLKHKYGLTVEAYEDLCARQGGVCAICSQANSKGHRLVVDHCHESQQVRGLLCSACNLALGHFKDDPARLRAAIHYLQEGP
jgi:hypothetical protein